MLLRVLGPKVVLVALLLSALPGGSQAQLALVVGGGGSLPLSTYGEIAELGVQGLVGVTLRAQRGMVMSVSAFFNRNPHTIGGDRSHLYGLSAAIGYALGEPRVLRVTPSFGITGMEHARRSDTFPGLDASERGLGLTAGTTISRLVGRLSPFLSVSYTRGLGGLGEDRYPTEWLAIGGGVEIPLTVR